MEDRLSKLIDEGFWSDSVRNIALEFEVPPMTAASWERNIGDVEVLKQTVGKNGSDNYVDLIRRREWIPYKQEDREGEWVESLKRWCTRRVEDVFLVHESESEDFRSDHGGSGMQSSGLGSGWMAVTLTDGVTKAPGEGTALGINWTDQMAVLQEELEQKEEWVKYEMRRVDPEWIGLARKLRYVEKELIKIYLDHLDDNPELFKYKKDEIIELKRAFPYLRANADLVVEATNSSYSYVNEFKYFPEDGVANRRAKGKLRDEVLQRDGHNCVSCGSENDLEVHHIIPRDQGGENAAENLSTLCTDCHYYAHGGGQPSGDGRHSTANWDSVEYNDQTEFWEDWIQKRFEKRVAKGDTRVDIERRK